MVAVLNLPENVLSIRSYNPVVIAVLQFNSVYCKLVPLLELSTKSVTI